MRFGSKFGCPTDKAVQLLTKAYNLQLQPIGVSFHIGSGCQNAVAYERAIELCRQIQLKSIRCGLPPWTVLDLGGGYPGCNSNKFETFAQSICKSLHRCFSNQPNLSIIAEPGRCLATQYSTIFSQIQGMVSENSNVKYYLDNGVYGSFNSKIFDHAKPEPISVASRLQPDSIVSNRVKSTFFGPTCDSMDEIAKDIWIERLNVNQWVYFPNSGAYGNAAASTFNGIQRPVDYYFRTSE